MLAISNVRLIDGTGADLVDNITALVGSDGIIAAVGPAESVDVPPDARNVNGLGLTLLPGLIDCHDHLAMQGYDLAGRWGLDEPGSLRTLRVARTIEDTLLSGYTTVRDAGWLDAGFKYAVDEGVIDGPRPPGRGQSNLSNGRPCGPEEPVLASSACGRQPRTAYAGG